MKRRLLAAIVLLLIILLCACGAKSEDFQKAAENSPTWGSGDKLVFYDVENKTYHTQYASPASRAQSPDEVGGIVRFSADPSDADKIHLTLRNAKNKENVVTVDMNKAALQSGEAGLWAEKQWQDYVYTLEIRELIRAKQVNGDKMAAIETKQHDGSTADFVVLTSDKIPEDMRASSLEEVGILVRFEDKGNGTLVCLYEPNHLFSRGSRYVIEQKFFQESESEDIADFLRQSGAMFLRLRSLYGNEAAMGSGTKLIGEQSSWEGFTDLYIPKDLVATSPEDVGLFMETIDSESEVSGFYSSGSDIFSQHNSVKGTAERFCVTLINPADGSVFLEEALLADLPSTIQENSFEAKLSYGDKLDFVKQLHGIFLYDRRIRGMIEDGRIGGEEIAVFDDDRGVYLPQYVIVGENADQIGAVLHIHEAEAEVRHEEYGGNGFSPTSTSVTVTLLMQKLYLELQDPVTSQVLKSGTLTATEVPDVVHQDWVEIPVAEEAVADWVSKNRP